MSTPRAQGCMISFTASCERAPCLVLQTWHTSCLDAAKLDVCPGLWHSLFLTLGLTSDLCKVTLQRVAFHHLPELGVHVCSPLHRGTMRRVCPLALCPPLF